VRGTTEGINLVANAAVKPLLKPGDEVLVTQLEHHANIVPWQMVCHETGATLKAAPVLASGDLDADAFERMITPRTRFAACTHVSNALGTLVPARAVCAAAHAHGVPILIDGAQSAPHLPIDVTAMDCDWFVCSGHKMCGPTGIGLLYGKKDALDAAQPWQGGGNMIKRVTIAHTDYESAPAKFEAGTGSIADAAGLGAAIRYLSRLGMDAIAAYEHALMLYAERALSAIPGVRLVGSPSVRAGSLSFVKEGCALQDISDALNARAVAIRTGHHCAQPILDAFGLEGTARASFAFYNTFAEIDTLAETVASVPRGHSFS